MKKINSHKKIFSDERVDNQKYRYAYETLVIVLVLLFIDFMYKIYRGSNGYISSAVIFIVAVVYLTVRIIQAGIFLPLARLDDNPDNKNVIRYRALKRSGIGTSLVVMFDIISRKSVSRIAFGIVFWFVALYIMVLFFAKIGIITDNKEDK